MRSRPITTALIGVLTCGAVGLTGVCAAGAASAAPPADTFVNTMRGDFNGDGRDDIATFTRGQSADVSVALSDGHSFVGTGWQWHDWFAAGSEVPAVGDFNGDGCSDIATFTRGGSADVYVALSNCTDRFEGTGLLWHDFFAAGSEVPTVGDFNGDSKDDIATFTRGQSADVYVALSNGESFGGGTSLWHDWFAVDTEVPAVGDFDGDGCDDVVTFTRGQSADVYVALSNCIDAFKGTGWLWHDYFAAGTEIPAVGDLDGDGRDDILSFTRGTDADVYAAQSLGDGFIGTGYRMHDYFAAGTEIPGVGDFDGNGCADIAAFTGGAAADVYVAGNDCQWYFTADARLWHDYFAAGEEVPAPGMLW